MHIQIVAVGKLKERFWKDACEEYIKRLKRYTKLDVVEVLDRDPQKSGGDEAARAIEKKDIQNTLLKFASSASNSHRTICLDSRGKMLTSEEISQMISNMTVEGVSEISFIIGGSTGLDQQVLKDCDEIISFGKITLAHNLARVVLLEQLYRAFRIMRGEPYHK